MLILASFMNYQSDRIGGVNYRLVFAWTVTFGKHKNEKKVWEMLKSIMGKFWSIVDTSLVCTLAFKVVLGH